MPSVARGGTKRTAKGGYTKIDVEQGLPVGRRDEGVLSGTMVRRLRGLVEHRIAECERLAENVNSTPQTLAAYARTAQEYRHLLKHLPETGGMDWKLLREPEDEA